MLTNVYTLQEDQILTSISGGRLHHEYRQPVRATSTYEYELHFGENYHTMSMVIFGSDTLYWALSDMNKPKDAFSLKSGDRIVLPDDIVRNINGIKKFV